MSAHPGQSGSVVPAQLTFLAIYNPSLGNTDDTLRDQIVFYWSRKNGATKRLGTHVDEGIEGAEERNEQLRRIGLAQGMVEFARSFSENESVNSVETEKSRIVLHELEPGWWILASIDLTRLPSNGSSTHTVKTMTGPARPTTEYSAREVSPPHLLIAHLCRAHAGFLLHNATSLSELYSRVDRSGFCSSLYRFWNRFAWNWDVLLHGNPSVDIFAAIKLAGGGELGMGVGEEDRGSGEREVLEGFVGRIEGLIDLIVSRFGDPTIGGEEGGENSSEKRKEANQASGTQQLGSNSIDGAIFLGVGALARTSLRDITNWMEELYELGEDAYGVNENPTSTRRRKRRKPEAKVGSKLGRGTGGNTRSRHGQSARVERGITAGKARNDGNIRERSQHRIPPPIVSAVKPTVPIDAKGDGNEQQGERDSSTSYGTGKLMKYLTLGYGSPWRTPSPEPKDDSTDDDPRNQAIEELYDEHANLAPIQHIEPQPDIEPEEEIFIQKREKTAGHFLVGLKGDVEDDTDDATFSEHNALEGADINTRILLRTVQVEMEPTFYKDKGNSLRNPLDRIARGDISEAPPPVSAEPSTELTNDPNKRKKCRVVVYVYQPFIFTFLFEPNTKCLAFPTFYRSLHHQLGPLQRPLLSSTSSALSPAIHTGTSASIRGSQPIHDLIYDPKSLTTCSSIPSIPLPAPFEGRGTHASAWTRVEALNVHQQVLNIFASTRHRNSELERTCKTSRGWWVVWVQLPNPKGKSTSNENNNISGFSHQQQYKEAILVRKSSDYAPRISSLSSYGKDEAGGAASGVVGLAEGIGVDTRKYIESLLSLNR